MYRVLSLVHHTNVWECQGSVTSQLVEIQGCKTESKILGKLPTVLGNHRIFFIFWRPCQESAPENTVGILHNQIGLSIVLYVHLIATRLYHHFKRLHYVSTHASTYVPHRQYGPIPWLVSISPGSHVPERKFQSDHSWAPSWHHP